MIKKFFILIAYMFIVLFSLELLNNMDLFQNPVPLVFAILFLFLLYTIVFGLSGRMWVSVSIVNVLLLALYIINYYRVYLSGLPFAPIDLTMAQKAADLALMANVKFEPILIPTILIIIVATIALYLLTKKVKFDLRERMVVFSGGLAIFLFVFMTGHYLSFISPLSYTILERYKENGVVLGFFMSTNTGQQQLLDLLTNNIANSQDENNTGISAIKNAEYGQALMDEILLYVEAYSTSEKKDKPPVQNPNIIVIMSEAFTDPTEWEGVTFSADPVPNLHRLQSEYAGGKIITPALGGATCDPEYEFLTGNSLQYISPGIHPFQLEDTYITGEDKRALPYILKEQGYSLIGVHPFTDKFYQRKIIYSRFGFDRFILADDMPDAPLKGGLISDSYFTDRMIDIIDEVEEPLFLYGISMQNHYSYWGGRYGENVITLKSDMLDERLTGIAETYVHGVNDADKELGRLIEHIEKSEEPTIVFFFGDHQPLLGEYAVEVFQALSIVDSTDRSTWTSAEEKYTMHTTPYVVWANYDILNVNWENMSSFFIGAKILEATGIDANLHYSFLSAACNDFHGIIPGLYENEDGTISTSPLPEDSFILTLLSWIQYDAVYGERYITDHLSAILNSSK